MFSIQNLCYNKLFEGPFSRGGSTTPDSAQGRLQALCFGISSGGAQGTLGGAEDQTPLGLSQRCH